MGAFEDRLAAGYRQAANTPAKMPQPTTPTEALATALHKTGEEYDECRYREDQDDVGAGLQMVRIYRDCDPDYHYGKAEAILDALPPGWRLVGPDDVTVTVGRLAAALLETRWWVHALLTEEWSSGELADAILAALSANHTPSPSADRPRGDWWADDGPDWKQIRKDHGLPSDSESDIIDIWYDAAAAERRRLLEVHMADHDDATGWCPTCALLTEGER